PHGPQEGAREREDEEDEKQADPAVDEASAQGAGRRPRSTYVVVLGSAGRSPSRLAASVWIRCDEAALESCDWSTAFSARRFARSRESRSSSTFSRSTATLSATMPVSSTATTTLQTTPPATRRPAARRRPLRRPSLRCG